MENLALGMAIVATTCAVVSAVATVIIMIIKYMSRKR